MLGLCVIALMSVVDHPEHVVQSFNFSSVCTPGSVTMFCLNKTRVERWFLRNPMFIRATQICFPHLQMAKKCMVSEKTLHLAFVNSAHKHHDDIPKGQFLPDEQTYEEARQQLIIECDECLDQMIRGYKKQLGLEVATILKHESINVSKVKPRSQQKAGKPTPHPKAFPSNSPTHVPITLPTYSPTHPPSMFPTRSTEKPSLCEMVCCETGISKFHKPVCTHACQYFAHAASGNIYSLAANTMCGDVVRYTRDEALNYVCKCVQKCRLKRDLTCNGAVSMADMSIRVKLRAKQKAALRPAKDDDDDDYTPKQSTEPPTPIGALLPSVAPTNPPTTSPTMQNYFSSPVYNIETPSEEKREAYSLYAAKSRNSGRKSQNRIHKAQQCKSYGQKSFGIIGSLMVRTTSCPYACTPRERAQVYEMSCTIICNIDVLPDLRSGITWQCGFGDGFMI